jgi:hypothetical protein
MSRSAKDPPQWVWVLGYIVASQVSQGGPETLRLTEAILRLLAQYALAAYTSELGCITFLSMTGCSGGLPEHPCTVASPYHSVPQQVRTLLLIALWHAGVLARLSLDRYY